MLQICRDVPQYTKMTDHHFSIAFAIEIKIDLCAVEHLSNEVTFEMVLILLKGILMLNNVYCKAEDENNIYLML